ncbi:agmatinase family protein [Desmospora profundinema]|uniref:Formiminoglutamase n=1 Tax=Desmospora profundinema TaxID=1571184 RepID=A0ABU1IJY0_9BACL|nr:agmatinase family protein [Desmospora profundinema]MDR6224125.1 formiminoglutamase [Desmospora profundinema]
MDAYPYPMIQPPPFHWDRSASGDEPSVHQWIQTLDPGQRPTVHGDDWDVTLLGVPLSRSSISASAASENPDAIRRAWRSFIPYHLEEGVDLTPLRVLDLGNVRQHVTDIAQCHQNIRQAVAAMRRHHPQTFPLLLGGDHSVTAMAMKGWKEAHPEHRLGILQLDTHFDLRPLEEHGPSNGTPIRNLIESGTLRGEDVVNIGLHGFFNARSLREYADKTNVRWITLKQARREGVEAVVRRELEALAQRVDAIHFTLDMDVLDVAYAPGVPASTPGGMRTDELFDACLIAGRHTKVTSMDLVCLDPYRDVAGATVKAGVHAMLSFLTGYVQWKGLSPS